MDKLFIKQFSGGLWGLVVFSTLEGYWSRRFPNAASLLAYLGL